MPKKTKEMIFDFRVNKTTINSISLNNLEIERVSSFKLLGIWLDDNLKWNSNTDYIVKKARKRLYFLKVLKRYGAPTQDLNDFIAVLLDEPFNMEMCYGMGD